MNESKRIRKWLPIITRRHFFRTAGATAAVAGTGLAQFDSADDLVRLDVNDPTAKALNYVHDAKTVDAAKRASNQFCSNCALFAGDADDEWAGCSIFPGKAVAGQGWCNVWASKPTSS